MMGRQLVLSLALLAWGASALSFRPIRPVVRSTRMMSSLRPMDVDKINASQKKNKAGGGTGMTKAEVDAYLSSVKAQVDQIAAARTTTGGAVGMTKAEVDAYISSVKAEVDQIAAARTGTDTGTVY